MVDLRIALAQTNPTLGALESNLDQILAACHRAASAGAQVVVTGEMALTGHPVDDLALDSAFVAANKTTVLLLAERLVTERLGELTLVVGHLHANSSGSPTNAASVLRDGDIIAVYEKRNLPADAPISEHQLVSGTTPVTFEVGSTRCSVAIGQDICADARFRSEGVQDADVLLVLDGRPFVASPEDRAQVACAEVARANNIHVARVNLTGAQDDLVFEGGSFVLDASGTPVGRAAQFTEEVLIVDLGAGNGLIASRLEPVAQTWSAVVLGLRDYVEKNGFNSVLLGMSGGIDSTIVAALAVDALGPDRVFGVSNPSAWSSEHSRTDAQDQAERLGISLRTIPIAPIVDSFQNQLSLTGVGEENLQARVRAVIWMGLSNQEGHVVLACGNKSELSVGYSTIYGDAVGGYAPIKDVPKTLVWEMSRWRNEQAEAAGQTPPIPDQIINKPPSAELRPGQLDLDSLPPYEVLDPILEALVERSLSQAETIAEGHDPLIVKRVAGLVDRSEYKRYQYPPGPKVSKRAFDRDRRVPVSHRWSAFS